MLIYFSINILIFLLKYNIMYMEREIIHIKNVGNTYCEGDTLQLWMSEQPPRYSDFLVYFL